MELVNLFWDGSELGKLETTCIKSYLNNNHLVNLFTYNKNLKVFHHKNLKIVDANEILEEKNKFYYSGNGDCPKNSVVGFSDIFRYKLLYEVGGWYSDMDVINLKNLSSISCYEIVLRPHKKYRVVSNICRFPKGYEPLIDLLECTKNKINESNNNWCAPLELFFNFVRDNKLDNYILVPKVLGNDDDKFIYHLLFDSFLYTKSSIKEMYGIHFCKSGFSSGNWNSRAIYNFESPKNMTLLDFFYYKYL